MFGIDIQEERREARKEGKVLGFKKGRESVLGKQSVIDQETLYALGGFWKVGKERFMLIAPVGDYNGFIQEAVKVTSGSLPARDFVVNTRSCPNDPEKGSPDWKVICIPNGAAVNPLSTHVRIISRPQAKEKFVLISYQFRRVETQFQ